MAVHSIAANMRFFGNDDENEDRQNTLTLASAAVQRVDLTELLIPE